MASRGEVRIGRSHGQRVPPLIKVIINTLRNYPDGSQILKELIQNADDACATEVEFLLDHSEHSSDNLIHPSTRKYQGPALYAWNNAVFGEEDWEGIRDISVSRKEKKVLKVGRFALGFISVYHITDFPCILSNDDVLLLDPHMVIDPTGGLLIGLDKFTPENGVASHLESFLQYFGYDGSAHYDGTIFRFPLRTGYYETSLPNNIYDPNKVMEVLFVPFKREIENCLLFLKSVTTIRVSVKDSRGVKLQYSAGIDPRCRDKLLMHRREMFEFIENGDHIKSSSVFISIFPTCFNISNTDETRLWLVLSMLGVGEQRYSEQLQAVFSKQSDSYLPWFALALPLPHTTVTLASIGSGFCWSRRFVGIETLFHQINTQIPVIPLSCEFRQFIGCLFCFLPIAASSRFPFHIHGYFALSTNRRSVKWPRYDDQSEEANWNMQLVKSLGTQCYAILIYLSVTRLQTERDSAFHYSLWSNLPPQSDSQQLHGVIHRGALEIIQNQPLVCTKHDSRWIQLERAMFLPSIFNLTIPHEQTCNDLLIALSQPVVNIPIEIANVIAKYEFLDRRTRSKIVSPSIIRQQLISSKSNDCLILFLSVRDNVFSLLEVVLKDLDYRSENLSTTLNGIQLIPICNSGLPLTFGTNNYYISEKPQTFIKLFPGLEHLFVESNLPAHINSLLLKLSRTNKINITDITNIENNPAHFVNFLESSMGKYFNLKFAVKWTPGLNGQPERDWIELVWKFIKDIKLIEELKKRKFPIFPKQDVSSYSRELDLLPLSTNRLAYIETSADPDYQEIESMLANSGCYLCERNSFIPQFSQFVFPPLPRGLFSMLQFANIRTSFLQKLSNSNNPTKISLRKIILSIELEKAQKSLVKSFPIFISISNFWVTIDRFHHYYLPPKVIPQEFSRYPQSFLRPFNNANVNLCNKVGVTNLSLGETVQHHLMPILCDGSLWDVPQERNMLSLWILRNSPIFADRNSQDYADNSQVLTKLIASKWLLDSSVDSKSPIKVNLYSPTKLFDPKDPLLRKLLGVTESGIFPNEIYDDLLDILRSLGLQNSETIPYNSLELVANLTLRKISHCITADYQILFNALIKLLSFRMNELNLVNKRQFWNIFNQSFLMASSGIQCNSYPNSFPFYTQTILSMPHQITLCSEKQACLIAGVAPVLVESSSQPENYRTILNCMGVQTSISQSLVCQQLKLIIETCKQRDNRINHNEIHSLVKKIYKYFGGIISTTGFISKTEFPLNFIFIPHQGFVDSKRAVLSCDEKLFPHIFSLEKYYLASDIYISSFFKHFNIDSKIDLKKCQFILEKLKSSDLSGEDVELALGIVHFYYDLIKDKQVPPDCLVLAQDSKIYLAKDCIFNDLNWMEHSDLLSTETLVHPLISQKIASKLGCQPASIALAPMTEDFAFGCGQSEDFVDRLRGILKGYRMEMDVFKELIQNSDDAGAHEVKILFDYSSYSCESIMSPRMGEVQGPALYFYNDAQFSPEDLDSIMKLSKCTKLSRTDQIGRFGVGFNAVYNFTDCPSFISGEIVQIFDPLQIYVGRFSRKSGVRFRYLADLKKIDTYHDMFEVYDGIFDCNILKCQPYKHTLFRLPFRKLKSQLSDKTFDEVGISCLQQNVQQELQQLIIFLQNITCIEVYEMNRMAEMELLLRVSKSECETTHFLQNHREYFQSYLINRPTNIVSSSDIVSIRSESQSGETSQDFLISYASGVQDCFEILSKFGKPNVTFLPLCGVAIPLSFLENIPTLHECSLYTFLPLPIPSPLLVHINGYFSLSDSRKNLSDVSINRSQDLPTEWNLALINDALPNALICALEKLHTSQFFHHDSTVYSNYFSLWPVEESTGVLWKKFPQRFAERIINCFDSRILFYSADNLLQKKISFQDSSFLSFQVQDSLKSNAMFLECVYALCIEEHIIFAKLPNLFCRSKVFSTFSGLRPDKIFDLKKLCDKFIFPRLGTLSLDQLVIIFDVFIPLCHNESNKWLFNLLFKTPFIPCGNEFVSRFVLRKPSEVVCPNTRISKLFQPQEMRQPVPLLHDRFDHTKNDIFAYILQKLEVIYDVLPESDIVSRCKLTTQLRPVSLATKHAISLIEYLYAVFSEHDALLERVYSDIKCVCFIPTYQDPLCEILSIPLNYFAAPKHCFSFDSRHLVTPNFPSASEEVRHSSTVLLQSPKPPLEVVFQVLQTVVSSAQVISESAVEITEKMLALYKYFYQIHDVSNIHFIKQKLSDIPWVFHPSNRRFYSTDQTIISPEYPESNLYLISFPHRDILTDKNFEEFLTKIGMKNDIDDKKIITCLQRLHRDFDQKLLPDNLIKFVIKLIGSIKNTAECSNRIFLLSRMDILHPPNEVYVHFSPHLEDYLTPENSKLFVHEEIHPHKAFSLGAKPSEEIYSDSFEFGLEENITDRIQNLIREMPISSIIKELIQNAEDAKASEIVFILDDQNYRNFNSRLCIPSSLCPNWEKLNFFPSLCVYNNAGFSDEDLEGIQKLSVGGKENERASIGKFGLGFNSVYRITDAPTFITSKQDRQCLTFCCFDPFLKYTVNYPGRKRGKRFDIGFSDFDKFSDQLYPFTFKSFQESPLICESLKNIWKHKDFTMFRLPLDIKPDSTDTHTMPMRNRQIQYRRSQIRKHCSLQEIRDEIIQCIQICPEMLLFLKNVKKLKVVSIDRLKKVSVHCSLSVDSVNSNFIPAPDWYPMRGVPNLMVERKEISILNRSPNQYLIYSQPDITTEDYLKKDPTLAKDAGIYHEEKLWGFGGVAVCFSSFNTHGRSKLFTFLPLGVIFPFPVHINAPLILDSSRQNIHSRGESWEDNWHISIIKLIIVPLYMKLLLDLRTRSTITYTESDEKYFDWYYSLFPKDIGSVIFSQIFQELYTLFYETNQCILLIHNLDISNDRIWNPLHGANCGVFKPSTFFSIPKKEEDNVNLTNILQELYRNKEDQIRKSLVLIKYPLTFAPLRLLPSFRNQLVQLDQRKLSFLKNNQQNLFNRNNTINLNHSVLGFKELQTILEFILRAKYLELNTIPLRVDICDNLRIFDRINPSYLFKYASLLPDRSVDFVSTKYDDQIIFQLRTLGFVKDLDIDYLANYLSNETPEYKLFWEYVLEYKLDSDDLMKFADHKLVPVSRVQDSNNVIYAYFKVNCLQFLLTERLQEKCPILFSALTKLGCPILAIDYITRSLNDPSATAKITSLFDSIAISENRSADKIIGSLGLSNPENLTVPLESSEADKLVQIFTQLSFQSLEKRQLVIMSSLKLFKTHSEGYFSLDQCGKCFISSRNLEFGPTVLCLLFNRFQLVVFDPISSQLLQPLCNVLRKQIVDINNLLLEYIFHLITEIPFEEQVYVVSYLSPDLARGRNDEVDNLISVLAEIPFIRTSKGKLYKVKDLYIRELIFINTFLPQIALPECWNEDHFKKLFRKLGLQTEVSLKYILLIAKSFSQVNELKCNLKILLTELASILSRIKWNAIQRNDARINFLKDIGDVRFLPAWKMDCITQDQRGIDVKRAKFGEAQQNIFQSCCCTTAYIHKFPFVFPSDSFQYLNVMQEPTPDIVKEHLKNISNQINAKYPPTEIPNKFEEYFQSTYRNLEKCSQNCDFSDLHNLRCILCGNSLYFPINMLFTSSDELAPFIIQIPPKLALDYPNFMSKIGVMEKANYVHFAYVLSRIHDSTRDDNIELNSNSKLFKQAEVVFNNLIRDLRKLETSNPINLDLHKTMLLTMNSELKPSNQVIYADNLSLLPRANKLGLNLDILNALEPDERKSCLPPFCLKLKKMSEILQENLDPNVEEIEPTDLNIFLNDLLCSPNFYRVLRRLYYHLTKYDLNNIFMANGQLFLANENSNFNPFFLQRLQKLKIVSVQQIDLKYRNMLSNRVDTIPDACSCYVRNNTLYLSHRNSTDDFILDDISYHINEYLGGFFKEVLHCFQLCFKATSDDLVRIMDKLDGFNIARDPWPLPEELNPSRVDRRSFSGSYGSHIPLPRPRPEGIRLGEPDIPAAKLAIKVSQCDLFAAIKLISQCEHNNYVFPAHACFLCFETVLKALKALLHFKGSRDRLTRERNMRKHLLFVRKILSEDPPHILQKIEELTIPLLNYDFHTQDGSTLFLPTIGCLIPQQIFSIHQAKEAIENATDVIKLLMESFPDLESSKLQRNDPIFSGSEPAIISTIRNFDMRGNVLITPLSHEQEDFKAISWRFYESMPHAKINNIKHIQNPECWSAFKNNVIREYNKFGDSCLNFQFLFHGTGENDPERIAKGPVGFNPGQGGLWGPGIYFAKNSSYSHRYKYSLRGSTSCVFAASVFVGYSKEMAEDRSIQCPPSMPNGDSYHSVQGQRDGEVIHTIYKSCMAYPAYLITYDPGN